MNIFKKIIYYCKSKYYYSLHKVDILIWMACLYYMVFPSLLIFVINYEPDRNCALFTPISPTPGTMYTVGIQ